VFISPPIFRKCHCKLPQKWEREKEDETSVTVTVTATYKQRRPIIQRLQQLHVHLAVGLRHPNCKWTYPLSAACGSCGWRWWSRLSIPTNLLFLLLVCFIGLSISQSINRLVYRQTAWTEITSRLTKYAFVVQLYPCSLLKPNTQRRRGRVRDSTRQLRRISVGGVYWA